MFVFPSARAAIIGEVVRRLLGTLNPLLPCGQVDTQPLQMCLGLKDADEIAVPRGLRECRSPVGDIVDLREVR